MTNITKEIRAKTNQIIADANADPNSHWVGTVLRQTEKAIHFAIRDGGPVVWLPKSQIEISETGDDLDSLQVGEVILTLPRWLARKATNQ